MRIATVVGTLALALFGCKANESTADGGSDGGAPTFVLSGVYGEQTGDAATGESASLSVDGNVMRFAADGTYSLQLFPCAPDGGIDASADTFIPNDCSQYGTYALAPSGTSLTLTDTATGQSTTVPFEVLATSPYSADDAGTDGESSVDGGIGLKSVHLLGGLGGGSSLTTGPAKALSGQSLVSLYKASGKLYGVLSCLAPATAVGANTGAMIRTATSTSFSCIQSTITFPSFDVPAASDGGHYCTDLTQPGCPASSYYGRRGVPYIYYSFLASSGARAECGFEYMPGMANAAGQPGNARWAPYIRDGEFHYSSTIVHPNTTETVWCGVESDGTLAMRLNGNALAVSPPTTPFKGQARFNGTSVHVLRITSLAWPATPASKTSTNGAISSLIKNGTYFPPYSCQPLNQFGPVTYSNTEVCPGTSTVPSVRYLTAPDGGNARWTSGGDGYTLSPANDVKETQHGTVDTDLLFPDGG